MKRRDDFSNEPIAPSENSAQSASHSESTQSSADPSNQFQIAAPTITLPKGGGAIRGIGEKFTANPVTGTGSMAVPIATSPGRGGFGPQLSLSYDSGAGNGPFGLGWNLSLPSITRKTDKGLPRYQDENESDVFILSGSEDLVPVLSAEGDRYVDDTTDPEYVITRYRPRVEGLFARIERWTRKDNREVHWRSITRDNILILYGKDTHSRIADPDNPERVFSWLMCETRDDKGNAILYDYKSEDGANVDLTLAHEFNRGNRDSRTRTANRYLKRVRYGNRRTLLENGRRPRFLSTEQIENTEWLFEVVFDYGEGHYLEQDPDDEGRVYAMAEAVPTASDAWPVREDPFSTYRAGFEVRTYRLCRRVLMFHHFPEELGTPDYLVRSTEFQHAENTNASQLTQVTQSGYKRQDNGTYLKQSLPPITFEYSRPEVQAQVKDVDPSSLEHLPYGVDGTNYQWVDLDGEGTPGILTEQGGGWYYKRNWSPGTHRQENGHSKTDTRFAAQEIVAAQPSLAAMNQGRHQFLDLAGNGCVDLVQFDRPVSGYYERTFEESWELFRPFRSVPNIDVRDPNLRFVDLTGDGHADILVTEHEAFVWYPSIAADGFEQAERVAKFLDEQQGPAVVFADGTQSIYLADMSGDGLTDLVRIRNGEVCYWPNRGYGRFGEKVTMDDAPHFDSAEEFDHRRIRLADIDGTSVIDIVFLGRDGVHLYFNQAGNRWSSAHNISYFPQVDNLASIQVTDLLGNGTACLVWASPLPGHSRQPMRYLELMGGQKPYLLTKTRNNLGASTEIQYAPSTKFYVADKLAGKPWITRLPFPVHCVERVTVKDKWRGTTFSTTYSYHHGYFDGIEREFRGFGRVEQIDTESFGTFAAGNSASPYITDDLKLYQPPVKTVTWFHTGAYLDRQHILSQYQHEYFPNWLEGLAPDSFKENELPEPDLQGEDLTPDEWREALRACKGMMLRQEVYELDVETLELQGEHQPVKLFSTAYHNCHIQRLQPRESNKHAVFLVTESEAITYNYELDLRSEMLEPDPRVAHTLNLNVDEYGNVLQAVFAVYPRLGQYDDATLDPTDLTRIHDVQLERHLAYTETRYTNDVNAHDDYRLRAPCEGLTYELTGITPANLYFTLEDFRDYRLSAVHQDGGVGLEELAYHEVPTSGVQKRVVEHVRMLFFNDVLTGPLPFAQLNSLGLAYETYKLALTEELLTAVFKEKFTDEVRNALDDETKSGYVNIADLADQFPATDVAGQYWIRSGIAGFEPDAPEHFYLPDRYTNAFGQTTTLTYDEKYRLFVQSSRDPLDNIVSITKFDYRVLVPCELQDINDNISEVVFDVLGLPTAMAVKGKRHQGDDVNDFNDALANPRRDQLEAFYNARVFDLAQARTWLGNATARHVYYFGETEETLPDGHKMLHWEQHPASACAFLRERHVAALDPEQESPLQVAFEYSDGLGAVLVKKVQAEPVEEGGALRWIGNGKTILNNKGKPVKQFEPYFSVNEENEPDHGFEEPREVGVTPVMYYDAPGRLVRTELPDGTLSRVEFSPWHVTTYDPNDTVLDPGNEWYGRRTDPEHTDFPVYGTEGHQRAARLAADHANTPSRVFLDSLGREVISVSHNRVKEDTDTWQDEKYITFSKLDAEGKPLWIRDARGNLVMQYILPQKSTRWAEEESEEEENEEIPVGSVPCYDIAGNLLFQHSMDAGDRWMLSDATGQPFYAWDINDRITTEGERIEESRLFHTTYDELRRPRTQELTIDGNSWSVERLVYGEDLADDLELNLRGQLYKHYDPSGLRTNAKFDFKGNLLEAQRELASEYQASAIDWPDDDSEDGLEEEVFTQITEYDALNRMTRLYNWHRTSARVAVYEPTYNERGVLKSENLYIRARRETTDGLHRRDGGNETTAIQFITYNAKGQRESIIYGNGAITRYDYDAETFRLKQLRTTRPDYDPRFPEHHSNLRDAKVLQQLSYTYDPTGNITEIYDEAYEPVYFRNQEVNPRSRCTYDALYRLIEAEGREQYGASGAPPQRRPAPPEVTFPIASPNDPNALRDYTQRYRYDRVGNILTMQHIANGGSWTRHYAPEDDSNRLLRTETNNPDETVDYGYDIHGSMLNLNRTAADFHLRWDYRDMIHHVNLGGGGQAFYNYDTEKQRTRKRIERNSGTIEERLYLGGMELYRKWRGDDVVEEMETHHLFAADQRVLIVEDVLETDRTELGAQTFYRYQLSNHLGSACVELDEVAEVISYEEYHPYGTTAYQAGRTEIEVKLKRYRYTGMERDEETGLSYHTARYYLAWLGRWGSTDPGGIANGINIFEYCDDNPVKKVDRKGLQGEEESSLVSILFSPERAVAAGRRVAELLRDDVVSTVDMVRGLVENPGFLDPGLQPLDPTISLRTREQLEEEVDRRRQEMEAAARSSPPGRIVSGAQRTMEGLRAGDPEVLGEGEGEVVYGVVGTVGMLLPFAGLRFPRVGRLTPRRAPSRPTAEARRSRSVDPETQGGAESGPPTPRRAPSRPTAEARRSRSEHSERDDGAESTTTLPQEADASAQLEAIRQITENPNTRLGRELFVQVRDLVSRSDALSPQEKVAALQEAFSAINRIDPSWSASPLPTPRNVRGVFTGDNAPFGLAVDLEGNVWQTRAIGIGEGLIIQEGQLSVNFSNWTKYIPE